MGLVVIAGRQGRVLHLEVVLADLRDLAPCAVKRREHDLRVLEVALHSVVIKSHLVAGHPAAFAQERHVADGRGDVGAPVELDPVGGQGDLPLNDGHVALGHDLVLLGHEFHPVAIDLDGAGLLERVLGRSERRRQKDRQGERQEMDTHFKIFCHLNPDKT
ncbi:MAG: hypothetical protein U1D99_07265 [Candidatus Omnitrophota bacterium]|nr:hypothetical protein [Candidatus Omnitrophota bacterium]